LTMSPSQIRTEALAWGGIGCGGGDVGKWQSFERGTHLGRRLPQGGVELETPSRQRSSGSVRGYREGGMELGPKIGRYIPKNNEG
jgi:hypothetical protein